jgi:hypothetical protein
MQMEMCLDTVTTLPRPVGVARAITTFTSIPVFYRLGHSNVASNSRFADSLRIDMYSFSLAYSNSTCRCLREISVEMRYQNTPQLRLFLLRIKTKVALFAEIVKPVKIRT